MKKNEELDAILNHMVEGVVVQNQDYVIEYMNQSAIRSFGNHVGQKCHEIFYQKVEPCSPCSIEEIVHKKKSIYQYSTKDPQGRTFEIIAQPLHEANEDIKVITLRRDVTERIQHFEEEKRLQLKVQEERILAIHQVGVSLNHGINNSLTAIFGSMELFKGGGIELNKEAEELIQMIESEAEKIKSVVSKLNRITDPVVKKYVDNITMIDLDDLSE